MSKLNNGHKLMDYDIWASLLVRNNPDDNRANPNSCFENIEIIITIERDILLRLLKIHLSFFCRRDILPFTLLAIPKWMDSVKMPSISIKRFSPSELVRRLPVRYWSVHNSENNLCDG